MKIILAAILLVLMNVITTFAGFFTSPEIICPSRSLQPNQLAIIINANDPLSVSVGKYYQKIRDIPEENIITISFLPNQSYLDPDVFTKIKQHVDGSLSPHIQAMVLTWAAPYQVGGMSITSAFTFGYDPSFTAHGCNATKISPLFNSNSSRPYDDFGIRPCMSLASTNFEVAKKLIDRGKASDNSWPKQGTAYLMDTSDQARNVRHYYWNNIIKDFSGIIPIKHYYADKLEDKNDVLFYFTGLARVRGITTNQYLPGAIADHLTSTGGMLTDSSQMSALRWIEAGATGSYGAVAEPCNFLEKFPNPYLVMAKYLTGEPLIFAYWKSVSMPGQGIFIGDPLACPFGGYRMTTSKTSITIKTHSLEPGKYAVIASEDGFPPFRPVSAQMSATGPTEQTIIIQENTNSLYQIIHKK